MAAPDWNELSRLAKSDEAAMAVDRLRDAHADLLDAFRGVTDAAVDLLRALAQEAAE